jgi:hypothetical protein
LRGGAGGAAEGASEAMRMFLGQAG